MTILKPADLKIGDVVCFSRRDGMKVTENRFPFGDHQVIGEFCDGFTLRRPYVTMDGQTGHEDGWWSKDSPFEFKLLLRRWS